MFKVNDLVTGTDDNGYGYTNSNALCIVKNVLGNGRIVVEIVAATHGIDCTDTVNQGVFRLCSYEKFMEMYPEANFVSGWTLEKLNKIIKEGEETMEKALVMNKERFGNCELTSEEREILREEIIELLEEYDYSPTERGVDKVIDEWLANKGWMINLFKQHPNYNGKYQIAFDSDYNRICNKNIITGFVYYVKETAQKLLKEVVIGAHSYRECGLAHDKITDTIEHIRHMPFRSDLVVVNGMTFNELKAEKTRWNKKLCKYIDNTELCLSGGRAYKIVDVERKNKIVNVMNKVYDYTDNLADEDFANYVNSYYPEVKATAGQKTSRIVNKLCKLWGIDKDPDYNREFAKYSDTINPLAIRRHTVLSCHPVDYLTMSFGNSWASCHTIDKKNKRNTSGEHYHGMYSSGTMSYMLDESTFVYYTVDKEYNGNQLELQDKINRNMFHMGEDKLIQGRVYPQATDGETGIYRQIREIAQKTIADCLGVPNMWTNVKGRSECTYVINSRGTHYRDYSNFSDCNVSYLKNEDGAKNTEYITVGHNPICPCCGDEHGENETIECDTCYNDSNRHECYDCGRIHDEDEMHYIDGEWYCEDCCYYCEYHECWEVGDIYDDTTYVVHYGRVCTDSLYDGDFFSCERCDEWHHRHHTNYIEAEDGTDFCCSACAESYGYMETSDGCWYPEDQVYYCERCGETVHESGWDGDHCCCTDCVEDEEESEVI